MYVSGKCNGMFELLEIIKTTALSVGWEVKKSELTPFNDIPRDSETIYKEGSVGAISTNIGEKTSGSFRVLMPRLFSIKSVNFKNATSITVYGVLYDQTRELVGENITSGAIFSEEIQAKKYIQLEVVGNNIQDFHAEIVSDNINLASDLVITNNDTINNVYLNFRAFISADDKTNIKFTSSTGFSPELGIDSQLHSKVGYILGDDKECDYFLNLNSSRLILGIRLYRPNDAIQKNPLWQICYLGRLRIYGGEWALPDANAIIAPSFTNMKWNQKIAGANFTKPFVYFSGEFSEVNSTAFSSATHSDTNCLLEAPENGEIFLTPIICYNKENIFGQLDGIYNLILPDGVAEMDTISVETKSCVVVQDGIGYNKFDAFAIRKD